VGPAHTPIKGQFKAGFRNQFTAQISPPKTKNNQKSHFFGEFAQKSGLKKWTEK
jgi:hypothetical protein